MSKRIAVMLIVCILVTQVSFGDVWEDIGGYEYGDEPNPCEQAEILLQETPINEYGRIEEKLIAVVASKDATQAGKAVACRFLQQVGTERCIPAVSGLLRDEILSDYARLVLERLKSEQADKAMRNALEKAPDKARVGILASLAERRDEKAVKAAGMLANSGNPALAKAAIQAIGKIGGKEAAECLLSMKPAEKLVPIQMQAMVECARSLSGKDAVLPCEKVLEGTYSPCRIAALRELTNTDAAKASSLIAKAIKGNDVRLRRGGLGIIASTRGERLTRDMLDLLDELSSDRKAELIVALGARGDKAALKSIVEYISSEETVIRDASVTVVSKLGDASVVKLLLGTADSPEFTDSVTKTIAGMKADGINAVLVESLKNRNLRKAAIKACIARGCSEAVPDLLKLAQDKDPEVRKEAWTGLATLADGNYMNSIMEILVEIKEAEDLSQAEEAFKKVFYRAENRSKCFKVVASHYEASVEATKGVILDMGAATGDTNALKLVRDAMESGNKKLYARALRALAKWPNESAAEDLLRQARSASEMVDRVVALRGYIRIAGMETAGLRGAERMEMFKTAVGLAKRNEEKKAVLAILPRYPYPQAMALAERLRQDRTLAAEADAAIVKIKQATISKNIKATASINNGNVKNALDGNTGTRWDTSRPMRPGDWFMIDLGIERTVAGLTLNAAGSRGDYPRGYEVYVSFNDGNWGKPIVSGKGTKPLTVIKFPRPVQTRFIKIVQTGSVPGLFWSIHEMKVDVR
ncbi:MAG: HEAT repeat domain-containing protein [Planctomycetota bacterium]|jgi:HEAT repeat protein